MTTGDQARLTEGKGKEPCDEGTAWREGQPICDELPRGETVTISAAAPDIVLDIEPLARGKEKKRVRREPTPPPPTRKRAASEEE